ncbi:DNA damage-inducible transcript 4-like protein [Mercenaria mercenaria]|uniref:DNA damage-inducible transcript 4-like protein n=1 Tax=Mercenaria mercenaria TaxID=6596 RepID=UPI001E1D7B9B|nr:DNA damage-inducible transcript 4-like protein [Mercenaria mercenaria]
MENSTEVETKKEVMKMVHKFKTTFQRLLSRENQNVIETDYERKESNTENDKETVPQKDWISLFEDPNEEAKCKQFAKHIEDGLKEAREKHLKCEILIPCGLTMRIARDILIMSESEPCGVRGCSLTIHLQEKSKCSELVKVQYDPSTVSTFEIHLTLQEDTRHFVSVRKMMMQLTGCFKHSTYRSTPKMLCQAYKLEKQKLYRATC